MTPLCRTACSRLGFTEEKARESFGFLMDAYKFSAPRGGMAYGFGPHRPMLMLKKDSIRDVAFECRTQANRCRRTGCVDPQQLKDLSIALTLTE